MMKVGSFILLPCEAGEVARRILRRDGGGVAAAPVSQTAAAATPPPPCCAWSPSPASQGRRRRPFAFVAGLFLIPFPAFAGQPVDLRPDLAGHAGVVTLGDIFEGVEGASARKVVGRAPVGGEAVLDAGDVQLAARSAGLDWANSSGQRRIIVAVMDGPAETARPAHAVRRTHHSHTAQTLVYARNISVGEILEASDLEWSDEALAGADAPNQPDEVIGKAARLPLRAGAAVAGHELIAAKVIRRDQMISVDYEAEGVSLSLAAKAMGDAAVGDTVQAMNLSSKKVIEAVATAPGHAAVGPGADAARFPGAAFRTAANP